MLTVRGNKVVEDSPQYEHRFLDRINKSNFSMNFGINDTHELLVMSQNIANRLYTEESRELRNYVKKALSRNFIKSQVKDKRLSIKDSLDERNMFKLSKELECSVVMNENELRHFTTRKQYARIPQPKFMDVTPNLVTELQQLQKNQYIKDKQLKDKVTASVQYKNERAHEGQNKLIQNKIIMKRPQSSAQKVVKEPLFKTEELKMLTKLRK
ncbi:Hypothetical_protein [Hexamita inflata]|uniref:Hypothetical_protein n=1 Tax=Hexamita inflata TaxID=28002 RepID=A0ABP1GRU2_9EUKA